MLSVPTSSVRQPRKWTPVEDQKLREEVEEQQRIDGEVKDWCRIAQSLPGRTNKDCRKRWMNSVVGTLKKGQWSKGEDALLAKGVDRYGQKWTLVAAMVVSRSADQCSKRWCQSLDPELDRSEWRESEDTILIEAVQRLGRHWKDVQRYHFPGRSKNSIKNRYTVLLRRFQTRDISIPEGPGTPEASTSSNRLSTYSATDDETLPYTSGMYDDMMSSHTQVSTPESRHSWSTNDDAYTGWSNPAAYAVASTAQPSPTRYQHPPQSNVSSQPQWSWPPSTVGPPSAMTNAYTNAYAPVPISPYNPYGQSQGMYGAAVAVPSGTPGAPANANYTVPRSRAPTSSPRGSSTAQYHDPQALRYMRYGMQGDPQYRY